MGSAISANVPRLRADRGSASHARNEIADVLVRERVVERQHRARSGAPFRSARPASRRRVCDGLSCADQLGKRGFDLVVAPAQRVVFGVGDRRRVVLVVAPVVLGDLLREALELLLGFGFGELAAARLVFDSAHARARFFGAGCRRLRFGEQPPGGAARFLGDLRARQHARQLLDALVGRKFAHAGRILVARDAEMLGRARRDLRRMGDEQHLRRRGEALQPFADRGRHRAADAAIDFVEHEHRRRARFGKRNLQREREARELAARCDLRETAERRTLDGGDLERHAFELHAPASVSASGVSATRKRALPSFSGASSRATAASRRFAAFARAADSAARSLRKRARVRWTSASAAAMESPPPPSERELRFVLRLQVRRAHPRATWYLRAAARSANSRSSTCSSCPGSPSRRASNASNSLARLLNERERRIRARSPRPEPPRALPSADATGAATRPRSCVSAPPSPETKSAAAETSCASRSGIHQQRARRRELRLFARARRKLAKLVDGMREIFDLGRRLARGAFQRLELASRAATSAA